jgi:hypothetical protein
MATKKKSTKNVKRKPSTAKKAKQTLLAKYNTVFEKAKNILLTGPGAMGIIVDILFKTWHGEIGKDNKYSNIPLMGSWQPDPEIQGKYAEVFATFPDDEYRFPAYCMGKTQRDDVRNIREMIKQLHPQLLSLSLENIFCRAKFGDIEDLLLNVLDITKQLRRNVKLPFCIASPTVQLPAEFFDWADAIFDCDVGRDESRFVITDVTGRVK